MQRTCLLPVALTVLAITQNRGQTGMHLAPCPNAAGDGEIRRGPVPGRRPRVCRRGEERPLVPRFRSSPRLKPSAGSYTHFCKPLKTLGVPQRPHFNDFNDLRRLCIKMSTWR
jgi:hypothetical protein